MNELERKLSPARCAICGKGVDPAFKPFCSKRCADIDLNRWLSGVYVVPGRDTGTDEDETPGAPAGGGEER